LKEQQERSTRKKNKNQERSPRKKETSPRNIKKKPTKEAQERSTTQKPNHCLRRKLYPAERKTPTYGLQKYRDRKNIPVFRPERHTEESHIFKVFILQAQILKFLSRC
jgi:hypothetical protein